MIRERWKELAMQAAFVVLASFILYRVAGCDRRERPRVMADDAHPEWVTNRAALIMDYQRMIAGYEETLKLERSNSAARSRAAFRVGARAGANAVATATADMIGSGNTNTELEFWPLVWAYSNGPSKAIDYK